MNLEDSIKDVITKKLEDGTVEKLIAEQLENGIKNALKDLLGSYDDVTKIIEKQVDSYMVSYLENYDIDRLTYRVAQKFVTEIRHAGINM